MSAWPEDRGADERMEVYRVSIVADVASSMGRDTILEEIADLFASDKSPTHWDVMEVDVRPRAEVEEAR